MKRRRIYIGLAGCCFALCAAMAIMAVRSFWIADRVNRLVVGEASFGDDTIYSESGRIGYRGNRVAVVPPPAPASREVRAVYRRAQLQHRQRVLLGHEWRFSNGLSGTMGLSDWLGFRFQIQRGPDPGRPIPVPITEWHIAVPYWFLIAVTGAAGTFLWMKARRSQISCRGFCPICGYDLRATPERCPECGTVPAGPITK